MTLNDLLNRLRASPDAIEFDEVIDFINTHYAYTPTRFTNGEIVNDAGKNEGSCKIFYFGQMHALSEIEVLHLFGKFYRDDVLGNPAGEDHANIRNFILDGWLGINFDGEALSPIQVRH